MHSRANHAAEGRLIHPQKGPQMRFPVMLLVPAVMLHHAVHFEPHKHSRSSVLITCRRKWEGTEEHKEDVAMRRRRLCRVKW